MTRLSTTQPSKRVSRWLHRHPVIVAQSSLGLALLISGCDTTAAAAAPDEAAPIAVDTFVVTTRSVPRTLALTGTLIANREAAVAADGAGKVVATFVERGVPVLQGQPLVQLDSRAQAFQSAEANANSLALSAQEQTAELECERARQLFAAQAISRAELERATGSCATSTHSRDAARARARLAAKALGDSVVRAPFAGIVAERSVSLGEYVGPGTTIATLVDLEQLRLSLAVPESALTMVRDGGAVEFTVAAFPERSFLARIRHVAPVIRPQSRDQLVEALVDNSDGLLRPGMFAVARLSIGQDVLPVVPGTAISGGAESPRVFVVSQGRLEERVVLAAEGPSGEVVLRKGVSAGERLVATVDDAVRDGVRVR